MPSRQPITGVASAVTVSVRLRPTREAAAARVKADALVVRDREYSGFLSSIVEGSDQKVAYDAIAGPLLQQLQRGYSCTLLAYGQTGSGNPHDVRPCRLAH